jgi:hypothetical protein
MGGEAGATGRKIDPEKEELVRAPDGTVSIQELSPEAFAEIRRKEEARIWDSLPEIVRALRTSKEAADQLFSRMRRDKFKRLGALNSLQAWPDLSIEILEEVGTALNFSAYWAARTFAKAVDRQSNLICRRAENEKLRCLFEASLQDAVSTGELGENALAFVTYNGSIGNRIVAEIHSRGWASGLKLTAKTKLTAALEPRLEGQQLEVVLA